VFALGFLDSSLFFRFLVLVVNSSKVRVVCPYVSFFFARLRASLGASHAFFPLVENYVSEGSSLGVVLGDLFPLLCQSIDWFEGLVSEQREMSEVRSNELETGLSFNDNPMEVEANIAVSVPQEVRAFHTLGEVCSLDDETLSRFRGKFQFSERVRVRLP